MKTHSPTISNKRATFEYQILKRYTAGIVLSGTEVKAVREGKVNLQDGFCFMRKGELICKGIHISEYKFGTIHNHVPIRERTLLLTKQELKQLDSKNKEKGMTIIPIEMHFNERGIIKVVIGLAKGKKEYDKRSTIKEREQKLDLNRMNKHKNYKSWNNYSFSA